MYEINNADVVKFVKDAEKFIVHTYGKYIPYQDIRNRVGNEKRMIVGNIDDFYHSWVEKWTGEKDERKSPYAFRTHLGRMIFMNHPDYYWGILSTESQNEQIKEYGSEEEAKRRTGLDVFLYIAGHEILHNFENDNDDRPNWFKECATDYYQKELTEKLGIDSLDNYLHNSRRNKFEKLIEKYGDAVHKVYFGSLRDKNLEQEILAAINEDEYNELFPQDNIQCQSIEENVNATINSPVIDKHPIPA